MNSQDYNIYDILPVPKPRMTQRDKWLKPPRDCVAKYWSFVNWTKAYNVTFKPYDSEIIFILPMPKSWSDTKRVENYHQPHEVKPDLSNLLKALEDAVYKNNDQKIFSYGRLLKLWGYKGQIWIRK